MWTLTGPFDGEVVGELGFQKTKLLKTGTSYPLGRKGTGLIISSKKISTLHCEFVVGPYSVDDVGDPTKKPTLEFINKKDKGMRIARGDQELPVNPSTTRELHDGDIIAVVSGVLITVHWTAVCCFSQPSRGKSVVPLDSCAALGINFVQTPNPHVTHHLTSSYAANSTMAISLLSACQFVKPEWITEVLRLGNLPQNSDPSSGVSLERTFMLPLPNKYRPSFSPSLPPSQKVFNVWEPNEERLGMLTKYRFLWADEKAREMDGDFKEIIERGGGSFELFDIREGKLKLHRALIRGRAKEGKKQLIIGKESSIKAAIGEDGWRDLVTEAKTFDLHFIEPDVIIQVVVDVNTSLFDAPPAIAMDIDEVPGISSLPDFVPNTHPEELSIPPSQPHQRTGPPRRLTRRVTSRQASQEPLSAKSPEPEEASEIPRPRRALTRRVNAGVPVVTGLNDLSIDSFPVVPADQNAPPQPPIVDLTQAPTQMRSTKLKRRVVSGVAPDALNMEIFSLGIDEKIEEPPLKKFKALFEESHPDHTGASTFDETALEDVQNETFSSSTETQSQVPGGRTRLPRSGATTNLTTLREEEEEETQLGTASLDDLRGTKRSREDDDVDVEMAGIESETLASKSDSGPSAPKKRAVEHVNAVEKASKPSTTRAGSKPPSSTAAAKLTKSGAAPGQPDKDVAFLKAIASTKKGKKTEDEFDRDFNKLKISKPELAREEPQKQWAILDNFSDETNIRGNFMVIVEMEVHGNQGRQRKTLEPVREWQGKPNFKKFKKKDIGPRKASVDLFVSEGNDYGIGPAYWKGGKTQSQSQGNPKPLGNQISGVIDAPAQTSRKTKSQVVNDPDDSDEVVILRKGSGKSSRAGSSVPPKRASSRTKKAPAKSQPLFLESDNDDDAIQEDPDEPAESGDDELTLRSTGTNTRPKATQQTRRPPSTRKKAPAILADDDSDDGAVFKGFKGRTRRGQ